MPNQQPPPDVDVAIIGGGIQGAGIAQACAAAGYSCTLIEKSHLAAGTSSQSSKLIHGGLRYLESYQFGLVRHNLKERERLLKLAPDLIQRREFLIPIYPHSQRRPWQLYLGLGLYRLLAGENPFRGAYTLPQSEWAQLRGINLTGLSHVFCYNDAQTDDRLLTQAVMYSAESLGAQLLCPVMVEQINRTDNGYDLHLSGAQNCASPHRLSARLVINATGPWVNQLLQRVDRDRHDIEPSSQQSAIAEMLNNHENTKPPKSDEFSGVSTSGNDTLEVGVLETRALEIDALEIDLVQGSHLLLNNQLGEKAFYLEAPCDKRAVFVIPWQGKTLLGTTELLHKGRAEDAAITAGERNYLLRTLRHYFPDIRPDVEGSFCGLRVLPKGQGSAFSRPREVQLHSPKHHSRLLSVYGGKLTGYRDNAQKVVQWVNEQLGARPMIAETAELYLEVPPGALPARAIAIEEKTS